MEQKKVHKNIFIILTMLVFLFSWCSVAHAEEESVLLKDMYIEDFEGCSEEWEKEIQDPNGKYCSRNILSIEPSGSSYVVYNLDDQYTRFSGKIVIHEMHIDIGIYGDSRELYIKESRTPVQKFEIDVTGVERLEIRVYGTGRVSLQEGTFTKAVEKIDGHVHTPGDWEEEEKATCDKEGKKVQRCTECKEICNTQEIKALGHTPGDWETEKEATCKAEGKRVKYCTVCKKVCAEESVDRLEHEPGDWEVESEPTCEEEGEKVRHCKVCGEICDTEYIPETGHEPGDWEVETEATCWSEGEESVHCKYCGEWLDSREIPPVEHKEEEEWFVQQEPSCTYEGTRVKRCIYCGETVKVEKIPKTKHKFGKWVTVEGSVWNSPIVKTRICSSCFSEETKNVYAWVWVKPVVIILVFLIVLFGVTAFLMSQKGIQLTAANIKEFFRNGIRNIKYRSKDEEFGDDIFGRTERNGKKKEEKDKDDIF